MDEQYTPGYEEQEQSSSIDIQRFVKGIWKRKFIIIALAILVAIPFYNKAKNQIPIYRCKVLLRPERFDDNTRYFNNIRQIEMKSRPFARRVAANVGLAISLRDSLLKNNSDVFSEHHTTFEPVAGYYSISVKNDGNYYLKQQIDQNEVLIDSANVWDAVDTLRNVNGLVFSLSPQFAQLNRTVMFRVRPFEKAVKEILYGVAITFNRSETVMALAMEAEDPDVLPEKLNRVAEAFIYEINALLAKDNTTYRRNLEQQLYSAEAEVKKLEADFRAFNSKYPLSLEAKKKELETDLRRNANYLESLPQQRAKLDQLLEKLDDKDHNLDEIKYRRIIVHQLATFGAMKEEPTLNILQETLSKKEQDYDIYYRDFGPENPDVHSLKQEIYNIQDQIIEFASRYMNTLAEKEKELLERRETLQKELADLPYDEQRKSELERQKQIVDEMYSRLFSKMTEVQMNEAVESKGLQIMEPAVRPGSSINPGKKTSILMGGGLGLVIGLLLSIGLDIADKRIRTPSEVEKHLKLDVLGTIPVIEFKDVPEYHDFEKIRQIDKQLVTHDYSPTPIGESYRALRTQLMYSKKTGKIQSLVLTSFEAGDGKSFTASNLAIILAQQKSSTLLVDADLRRGVLHNTFSVNKEPGLTNYLTNKATLNSIVQDTHIPNLSIISCGSMIPNPSELLGSMQMRRFLEEVKRKFDLVIFDTPPIDAATDSIVLGAQVNAMAVVVRAGVTKSTTAKEKLEIFETIPANLIGAILNGTETTFVNNSYSYYHY